MKRAGGDSALGGSFAVVRTADCHRQKTLRAPLFSYLPGALSPSFLFFFTFSLARISAGAVSKLFLCLAVKDHTACVYIYFARISRIGGVARSAVACLVP